MDPVRLAAALRGEDPEAARELVDSCGDRLLRSAFLLCGNEADAEDLVQETFLQAVRSAHRFEGRSSVYTWLHGILLNLTRHYHRSRKHLVRNEEVASDEATSPERLIQAEARTVSNEIDKALSKLSGPHREVLVLRYYENMKIGDIAQALGVSLGTVKSRLHYALREAQKFLPREMNLFGAEGTHIQTMQKR